MSDKFLPNKEGEFRAKVQSFATQLAKHPERYRAAPEEAEQITAAVNEYLAKSLAASNRYRCSPSVTAEKRAARKNAERLIRRLANRIRIDETISTADKIAIGMKERAEKARASKCPWARPALFFDGTLGTVGTPGLKHQLRFSQPLGVPEDSKLVSIDKGGGERAKPPGVARVEIFMELVAEGEPMPRHPAELSGGRLWFVGAFTRNPMVVDVPIPSRPMRVVYWARWAGHGNNDVGPFSKTCVADLQGAALGSLALCDYSAGQKRAQRIIITSAMRELPDCTKEIEVTPEIRGELLLEAGPEAA